MDIAKSIIDRTKNGKTHLIFCEPLNSFHLNLAFCPYREECEFLTQVAEQICYDSDDIYEMLVTLTCECPREEWIVVATEQGGMIILTVDPEIGREIKESLDKMRPKP